MTKQTKSNTKPNRKNRKTRKNTQNTATTNKTKSCIVAYFLQMLNTVKLYHWKTKSYSQHKATDELYAQLNTHIDKFVEVLLGKTQGRIKQMEKHISLYSHSTTELFRDHIFKYRDFLQSLSSIFPKESDLLNIRDEMLADLNQFLYLQSFDK